MASTVLTRVRSALLAIAVALAFADASIVVLALPEIYGELETTVVGVSWVITTYALVVAVVGLGLAIVGRRRLPSGPLLGGGMVLFAAASIGCGLAGSMPVLIGGRVAQAIGATLLLSGALGAFEAHLGATRGRWAWSLAATIGLAIGPALGGVLTELFDWRAIFLAQAPFAFAALLAGASRDATAEVAGPAAPPVVPPSTWSAAPPEPSPPTASVLTAPPTDARAGGRRSLASWLADGALVFVSAGLVGALFLGVLLVIEVWRFSPISGALVVSVLPIAVFVVRPLRHVTPPWVGTLTGCIGLGLGLAALAFLPAASAGWAAVALAVCGAGFGLVDPVVGDIAEAAGADAVRTGARTVAARHLGLVVGLVVIAPALAADLDAGAERAIVAGADTMLDVRLPVRDKIRVARAVADVVQDTPRGKMPSTDEAFVRAEVEGEGADVASLALRGRVEDVLTRSFRRVFLLAGLLALLGAVPAVAAAVAARERTNARRWPVPAWVGIVAAFAVVGAGVGVLIAERDAGAADYGEVVEEDPCTAGPDPYSGRGLDATVQRFALSGLNGAACDLAISRERLILSLAEVPGIDGVDIDEAERDDAIKSGLVRAIDDAEDRGTLPGWVASGLRFAAERAPVGWVVNGVQGLDLGPIERFFD